MKNLTDQELLNEYLRIRDNLNNAIRLMQAYKYALMPQLWGHHNEYKTRDFNFKLDYKYSFDSSIVSKFADYRRLREQYGTVKRFLYTEPNIETVGAVQYDGYLVSHFDPQTVGERYAFYYDVSKQIEAICNAYMDELANRYYSERQKGYKKIGDIAYRISDVVMIDHDKLEAAEPELYQCLAEHGKAHRAIEVEHANNDIDYVADKLVEDGKAEFLAYYKER